MNESAVRYNHLLSLWDYYYHNGFEDKLYSETPGNLAAFGYDSMWTLINVIDAIITINPSIWGWNDTILITVIDEILRYSTDFVGASGRVQFDETGDRLHGLYSFVNRVDNDQMQCFGYIGYNESGELMLSISSQSIEWPSYFVERGMIPRTNVLVIEREIFIDGISLAVMWTLLSISALFGIGFGVIWIILRKHRVIRAASWRLNVTMAIGGVFLFIAAMLYGIDERQNLSQHQLDSLCNVRLWMLTISWTVLNLPLFLKTYRLSRMFRNILTGSTLSDTQLLCGVVIAVIVDVLLLTVFILSRPLKRLYFDGTTERVDELLHIQYRYGSCTFDSSGVDDDIVQLVYGLIEFWKLTELALGVYAALIVSRIRDMTQLLTRFDETGIQILSILLTLIILLVAMTAEAISNPHGTNNFVLTAMAAFLIGNIVLWFNAAPRVKAVCTGNDKYDKSAQQKMEGLLKRELNRFSNRSSNANLL